MNLSWWKESEEFSNSLVELILLALHLCWFDAIEKLENNAHVGTWQANYFATISSYIES